MAAKLKMRPKKRKKVGALAARVGTKEAPKRFYLVNQKRPIRNDVAENGHLPVLFAGSCPLDEVSQLREVLRHFHESGI
jgi:hypothetical protein